MMTEKTSLLAANEHIERAINSLEMMKLIADGKLRLSPKKHLEKYYNSLMESVLALQDTLVSDFEYTDSLKSSIDRVSGKQRYSFTTNGDHEKQVYYSLEAPMLPLKAMKKNVAFSRRHDDVTISNA